MFRYTVDFPLNGKTATYILRNLVGGNGKNISKKFEHLGIGSATFGKQFASIEHDYQLNFDHDMGFLKFNIDLKDKIGAIMDQITDIVGAQRGKYTIMDNETNEEVCLDALNDEYPSSNSKHNSFRYSVRLFPNNVKSIQKSIYDEYHYIVFTYDEYDIILTYNEQEYECEPFTIDIDGLAEQKSICFYFNQTKLDINYINSIIYPIMKVLNYKRFDYVVDDYRTGEEIECEGDFIAEDPEHGFEFDSEEDEDNESTCSSYEFGQLTAEEAEEWLNEMVEEQQNYREQQQYYIYAIKNNKRETNYANMCESDAEDDSDDEWLPPAEQKAKERANKKAEKAKQKALKEKANRIIQEEKALIKASKALKKANMTEEEKAAYAAKVEVIIADRRAKKAARLHARAEADALIADIRAKKAAKLQAEAEDKAIIADIRAKKTARLQEEELHKAAYNEMYAFDEVAARQEEKEKKARIQKKLQRLHRQLN